MNGYRLRLGGLDKREMSISFAELTFRRSQSIFAAPSVGKYRFSVVFQNWSAQP